MFFEETYKCSSWNGPCKDCSERSTCKFQKDLQHSKKNPSNKTEGKTLEQLLLEDK